MTNIHFIDHSGFLIELEEVFLVFDFFQDPTQVLSRFSKSEKPFVFFVSHSHQDHWNQEILNFKTNAPIYYILDGSCDSEEVRQAATKDQRELILVKPGDLLQGQLHGIPSLLRLYVFGSTDEGSSFLLVSTAGSFIHMGDLNDWDWQDEDSEKMEADYKAELTRIAATWSEIHQDETLPSESKHLKLSFVPVDKRLEETALKGALTFLDYLQPEYLLPMHLSGGTELPRELANTLRQPGHSNTVQVLELTEPGQNISLV